MLKAKQQMWEKPMIFSMHERKSKPGMDFYLLKNMQCMTEHIVLTLADLNYVEPNILK